MVISTTHASSKGFIALFPRQHIIPAFTEIGNIFPTYRLIDLRTYQLFDHPLF